MLKKLRFHHIGVITSDLNKAIKTYQEMGFSARTEPLEVPEQKVKVCFMDKPGNPLIELIEPTGSSSPVSGFLGKNGSGPYHFCYLCDDILETLNLLKKNKFLIISRPTASSAFNNSLMSFAYKTEIGLIEIIQSEE